MKSHTRNPFGEHFDLTNDLVLIQQSLEGNRNALNKLLEVHNQFIFNVAIKMIGDVERAKDLTQDILIKITTNLSKYDAEKSPFRVWLYRLAFNHILDVKKSTVENKIQSFNQFFDFVDNIPDQTNESYDQDHPFSRETKIKCTAGMLMCLSREQRLLFVVGELFQIDHTLGAEIFNVSKANFRQRLSRTRKELYEWMNDRCGLINKDNPCRCAKKTKGFIAQGIVDPEALVWNDQFKHRIEDLTESRLDDIQISTDQVYAQIYRKHPIKEPTSSDEVMSAVLGDRNLKEFLDI